MNPLETRLTEGLRSLSDDIPDARGDLNHVKRVGRRRVVMGRIAVASATAALTLVLVGSVALLRSLPESDAAGADDPGPAADRATVAVTVAGVSGHEGNDLAGVLYPGGQLTDPSTEALGGFRSVIPSDNATVSEVVRQPGDEREGRFPFVTAEALTVEPGTYTLVLWVDTALNPVSRWVPINTDGKGLFGCHVVFEVGDDSQTDLAITPAFHPDGWNTDCNSGQAIPGTDAGAAVNPPGEEWWAPPELPMAMPEVSGLESGQTVRVTVSGVSGHESDDLAGVLYAGGELTDPSREALGGFWSVISSDDNATVTEVMRQHGDLGEGRFPFVTAEALTVEPGTYTLVLWIDTALNPVSRWVPINTDGKGLFGCHVIFEVGDDTQTDVAVAPNLHPDGWNINCAAG